MFCEAAQFSIRFFIGSENEKDFELVNNFYRIYFSSNEKRDFYCDFKFIKGIFFI